MTNLKNRTEQMIERIKEIQAQANQGIDEASQLRKDISDSQKEAGATRKAIVDISGEISDRAIQIQDNVNKIREMSRDTSIHPSGTSLADLIGRDDYQFKSPQYLQTQKGKLYFVGTIHSDLQGEQRLYKMLCYIRPDIILTEAFRQPSNCSPKGTNNQARLFIEAVGEYNREQPEAATTREELAEMVRLLRNRIKIVGYEGRAIQRYIGEHPEVQVVEIDDPVIVREIEMDKDQAIQDEGFASQISDEIASAKTRKAYQSEIDDCYRLMKSDEAQRIMLDRDCDELQGLEEYGKLNFEQRDGTMSKNIRTSVRSNSGKRIAFVAGGSHSIYDTKCRTVYSQTLDLNPEVLMLSDADGLMGGGCLI